MRNVIKDITPQERELLSRLRRRPELYLGTASLRDFFHMSGGYVFAMKTAGMQETHNLLPDGLNEYMNLWYGGGMGARNWYSIITLHERNGASALERFFEILDTYLTELGYAPIS